MRQFKDKNGKAWEINVNVRTIGAVRDLVKVNLPALFENKMQPLAALMDDPVKFVDVLWVLCRPPLAAGQADDGGEAFGAALGGQPLADAAEMFLEELIDFFPRAKAQNLRKVMDEARKVQNRIQERAQIDPLTEEGLEDLASKCIASFGDARALSASRPGNSPCAN